MACSLCGKTERPVPQAAWAQLEYQPSQWAYCEVHHSTARFSAVCTCRQAGKTEALTFDIHESLTAPPREGDLKAGEPPWVGLVSYDYPHAELAIDRLIAKYDRYMPGFYHVNRNDHTLTVRYNGARLTWYSAENPESVAGPTFTALKFDESQFIPDVVWNKARPTLNVRKGTVRAFGTPDVTADQSWFRGLWLRGQDDESGTYHSATVDCFRNPWITLEEIAEARQTMSEREFRMLYLAQWVDVDGRVFRKFRDCFSDQYEWLTQPEQGHTYVMSLDLAKADDYTVAYVADACHNRVVAKLRLNRLSYTEVEERVAWLYHHFGCQTVHADTTGVGEPVADALRDKHGLSVRPFIFTNKSKAELVSNLNRMLEHGELKIPAADHELVRELEVFQMKVTPSGNVIYTAPVNYFDDSVMSLGLLALLLRTGMYATESITESYATFGAAARGGRNSWTW